MKTYTMIAHCENCGREFRVELQCGIASKYQPKDCYYCGCEVNDYHRPIYEFEGKLD